MAEETKLKVGDLLTCHTAVVMVDGDIRTTVGKSYKIVRYGNSISSFVIKNDVNRDHYFPFDEYNKWFYNLKEERRKKLKKIEAQKNSD